MSHDLDDEEYEATRKMFNKDSDIEILEKYNSILNNAKANWIYEDYEILSNFKELYNKALNRVKELEEENLQWKGKYHLLSRKISVIPESEIKGKIEELNINMAEQLKIIIEFGEHEKNRAKLTMYKEQRDISQELLEEQENK